MTKTPDDRELDARIRDLLGHAVARTPQPPELDDHLMTNTNLQSDPNNTNRWMIGGGLGLGVAAAIAALLIVPNLGDDATIQTPADGPLPDVEPVESVEPVTTEDVMADPTISASDTEPGPTVPVVPATDTTPTTDAEAPPTSAPGDDGTDQSPPEPEPATDAGSENVDATAPPAVPTDPQVVVASADGISLDGEIVTTAVASSAMIGSDAKLWWTPVPVEGDGVVEGGVRSFDLATGLEEIASVPLDEGHVLQLDDVAIVQDQLTILYRTNYPVCDGGGDPLCVAKVRTFQPATGASETIAEMNSWEAGYGEFQLGDNGVGFGTESGIISSSATFFNISTGVTPTVESLGLEPTYSDCDGCPSSYTIDRTGAFVAWIEGGESAGKIVVTELQSGERIEVPVAVGDVSNFGVPMQIANVQIDGGQITSGAAVLSLSSDDGDTRQPLVIDLATGEVTGLDPANAISVT